MKVIPKNITQKEITYAPSSSSLSSLGVGVLSISLLSKTDFSSGEYLASS